MQAKGTPERKNEVMVKNSHNEVYLPTSDGNDHCVESTISFETIATNSISTLGHADVKPLSQHSETQGRTKLVDIPDTKTSPSTHHVDGKVVLSPPCGIPINMTSYSICTTSASSSSIMVDASQTSATRSSGVTMVTEASSSPCMLEHGQTDKHCSCINKSPSSSAGMSVSSASSTVSQEDKSHNTPVVDVNSHDTSSQSDSGSCKQTSSDEKMVEVKIIPLEMLYDGTMWSQIDFTKANDEEMFVSDCDSVALTVSDGVTDVARQVEVTTRSDNMCLSIRDISKREKDRQKKRVLRADPIFREKEKMKAKERMQQRRQDPMYREQERQRDRERRQMARRRNHTMRERERERDKEYKRNSRYGHQHTRQSETITNSCPVLDAIPCDIYPTSTTVNTEPS